jgi:hypothetical protein
MGKPTSGFSLPGFVCLAPSIYVQDAHLSAGGSQPNPDPYLSSQTSFSLPSGSIAESHARSRDTAPPDLIIITSWTGAAAKHVAKYTSAYNDLYPGVPILVITTVLSDLTIHSTNHKLKVLAPAVEYLLSHHPPTRPSPSPSPSYHSSSTTSRTSSFYSTSSQPHPHPFPQQQQTTPRPTNNLLLHAFSEGGAHKAVLLAKAYLLTTQGTTRLPLGAQILDSTPGRPSFSRASTAFARAMPGQSNPLVTKVLAPPLAKGVVGFIWAGLYLRGSLSADGGDEGDKKRKRGGFVEETRRALNDESLWDVRGMARTYLFGEGDEVVWWRDVQAHAVESAKQAGGERGKGGEDGGWEEGGERGDRAGTGVGSLVVRFKRTEHCAHIKGVVNGAVYWAAVRKTWDMRADGGMGFRMGLGRRLSLDSLCCSGEDEEGW